MIRSALLGALALFVVASTGPVPFQGKENVFKYTVSIGKEAGQTFKNGFTIDSDVVVRKRSDSTYFIKVKSEPKCLSNHELIVYRNSSHQWKFGAIKISRSKRKSTLS